MRAEWLGVRLSDTERKLLVAAAIKEESTQSEIARRGAIKEARAVLTSSTVATDNQRSAP